MIEPERRWYACSLKVEVLLPDAGAGRRLGEGALINVSPGGGVLSFPGPLRQGVRYTLKLTKPAVAVLPCLAGRDPPGAGHGRPRS